VETIGHLFRFFRGHPDTPEERERQQERKAQLIDKLARAIVARRLDAPATLFLELNRPIGFLFSQGALFARPFLAAFLPAADIEAAAEVLDDPQALDQLINRVGELSGSETS